jgi:hypothetical protein
MIITWIRSKSWKRRNAGFLGLIAMMLALRREKCNGSRTGREVGGRGGQKREIYSP